MENDHGLAIKIELFKRFDKSPELAVEEANLRIVCVDMLWAKERGMLVMEIGEVRMKEIGPEEEGAAIAPQFFEFVDGPIDRAMAIGRIDRILPEGEETLLEAFERLEIVCPDDSGGA